MPQLTSRRRRRIVQKRRVVHKRRRLPSIYDTYYDSRGRRLVPVRGKSGRVKYVRQFPKKRRKKSKPLAVPYPQLHKPHVRKVVPAKRQNTPRPAQKQLTRRQRIVLYFREKAARFKNWRGNTSAYSRF